MTSRAISFPAEDRTNRNSREYRKCNNPYFNYTIRRGQKQYLTEKRRTKYAPPLYAADALRSSTISSNTGVSRQTSANAISVLPPAHRAAKRRAEVLLPNPHIFRDPSPCRTADTAPLFLFIDDCFVGCTHINLSFLVFGYSIQYGMYYIWCIKIVFKLAPSEKFLGFAGCIKKEQTMYRKQYNICAIIKRKKRSCTGCATWRRSPNSMRFWE